MSDTTTTRDGVAIPLALDRDGPIKQYATDVNGKNGVMPALATYCLAWSNPGEKILDVGCGRGSGKVGRAASHVGCEYIPYDPYWLTAEQNLAAVVSVETYGYPDVVMCSGVLNVQLTEDEIRSVVRVCRWFAGECALAYFKVYPGDRSERVRIGRTGTPQQNQPLSYYRPFVSDCFADVVWSGHPNTIAARGM